MVALARGLGAACRISVARLRPAESDVRGRPSTWSETFGAVRQVRGDAEAGFWVVLLFAIFDLLRVGVSMLSSVILKGYELLAYTTTGALGTGFRYS